MSTEDKKPCLQGFVPPWSFLTRLRRPLLFRLAGKEGGEKGCLATFGAFCVFLRREGFFRAPKGSPCRGAGSAKPRLRGCPKFARKPKPRVSLAGGKGRNEHRGQETSLAAARSVAVVSDAPPAAPSFPSCRKRRGRKGALGRVWCVLPLNSGEAQCFRRRSTR